MQLAAGTTQWFGADGLRPVPEPELPAVLSHGPTRRFLAEVGLPRRDAAHLTFVTDEGALLRPLAERLNGLAADAAHLLVLGRTSLNWLLLDGRTGRVGLGEVTAAQPEAEVLIDPLASDLAVLMRFVHELDAVREAADDPSAREGRRGWDVVGEVHTELTDRLRGIDPTVFDPSGLAPHWSGLAFAHALRWAARRGVWVGLPLAFEITPELMAGFGQTQPVRPEDLPPSLTHEPTRSLLTTFGLPDVGMLRGDEKRPIKTLRERHPLVEEDELADPAQLDRICLGESVYDSEVLVDGGTGRLEIAPFEDWLATYLHTDLSAFYLAVWSVERLREQARPWWTLRKPAGFKVFRTPDLLAAAGEALLAWIDPSAVADEESLWNALVDDGHMGGLLGG